MNNQIFLMGVSMILDILFTYFNSLKKIQQCSKFALNIIIEQNIKKYILM